MPFQIAVAKTSIRFADPSRPTIWAPSSRPVRCSASTLTVIISAPGQYPAVVVDSTVAVT